MAASAALLPTKGILVVPFGTAVTEVVDCKPNPSNIVVMIHVIPMVEARVQMGSGLWIWYTIQ